MHNHGDIKYYNDIKKVYTNSNVWQNCCNDENCTKQINNSSKEKYCRKHRITEPNDGDIRISNGIKQRYYTNQWRACCITGNCKKRTYNKGQYCLEHNGETKKHEIGDIKYYKYQKKRWFGTRWMDCCLEDNCILALHDAKKYKYCMKHRPKPSKPNIDDIQIYQNRKQMYHGFRWKFCCLNETCKKVPSFNYIDKLPEWCKDHKNDDMINTLETRICEKKDCTIGAGFDYSGGKGRYCSKHKNIDMVDVRSVLCKSNNEPYNNICTVHSNPSYDGFCTFCFSHLFPNDPRTKNIRKKTKELKVRDYIFEKYDNFLYNKLITNECDCTKRRFIDLHKIINGTLLCIEIDENQHKQYNNTNEKNRYDDIFMGWSGKSIWIRYNPDKYKNCNGKILNPKFDNRMKELEKEINKQIDRIDKYENNKLCEIIELFYDK